MKITTKGVDRMISLSLELMCIPKMANTSSSLFQTTRDKFLNFYYSRNGLLHLGQNDPRYREREYSNCTWLKFRQKYSKEITCSKRTESWKSFYFFFYFFVFLQMTNILKLTFIFSIFEKTPYFFRVIVIIKKLVCLFLLSVKK